ncbi:MAG: right-handed parallel beta-helix repeat-containing protein, partial [Bacteroidota bacterium]
MASSLTRGFLSLLAVLCACNTVVVAQCNQNINPNEIALLIQDNVQIKITVTDESGNTYQELGVSRTSDVLGDCDWVESGENGLNIDEVWTIDFEVDLSFKKNLYRYTYVPNGYCVSVSQGDDAFYCHQGILPSSPVASFNDLYIVFHDEEFSFIPAGLRGYFVSNPGGGNNEVFNGRGIEDVFGDQWVWPYGFYNQAALHASVCQGLSGSQLSQCRLDADDYVRNVNYFIAPTASPPYEFGAGYDVVLPADAEWDWELESTVEFAPNTYLIVEGTLDADGITLAASDAATGWGGIRFLQGSDGTLENTAISGVGRVCPTGTCLDGTSVYIDKASPVFDNVDISTTSGAGTVHGVYVRGQQSFPHFLDTTIRDQSGDGIILTTRAKVFLDKAIVEDNGDDGIAAGFNTTAYLRETIIENNGGEGAIAFSGGEIAFGETGGPFGVTDGYNEVRMNGGFGLFAKKNSTIRAGDLASTRYNSIEGNAGTAKAAGSSAVAYVDYNYWGGGEPTLSQANGGQTYANRYCTQAPVLNSGCPSLPFGTSGSRVRGSDTDPAFASRYRRSGQASESGRRHAAQGDSTALEVISGANMMAALGQTEEAFAALTSVVEGYRADPSAGAAFGAIARLFLRDDIAGAIAFLDREAGSEETAHRLWAKEALARSYDALGQSEAAIKAA